MRKIGRLGNGGVSSADYRHCFVFEKIAVTHGTIAYSSAFKLIFTVNSQFFVGCTHAENNRFCLNLAVGTFKDKTVIIFSYADKGLSDKICTE